MQPKVEIFLDVKGYGRDLNELIAKKVSKDVLKRAKKIVAVDTGKLKTSIRRERVVRGKYIVYTDKSERAYNFAQEYGRPDLKRYTFTPYMRPAAFQAAQPGNMARLTLEANSEALRKNKKR